MDIRIWIFNIGVENWEECVAGPPEMAVHDRYQQTERDISWHGLSGHNSRQAATLSPGDTAIVRRNGGDDNGIMGIWEVREVAPVKSQAEHRWVGEYDWVVYCDTTQLEATFESPLVDAGDGGFVDDKEFVRFNTAANELSKYEEFTRRYLGNLVRSERISETTRRRLLADATAVLDDSLPLMPQATSPR